MGVRKSVVQIEVSDVGEFRVSIAPNSTLSDAEIIAAFEMWKFQILSKVFGAARGGGVPGFNPRRISP